VPSTLRSFAFLLLTLCVRDTWVWMPSVCILCKQNPSVDSRTTHNVPRSEERRLRWMNFVVGACAQRPRCVSGELDVNTRVSVCEYHFTPESYLAASKAYTRRLTSKAVPSIPCTFPNGYVPPPSHYLLGRPTVPSPPSTVTVGSNSDASSGDVQDSAHSSRQRTEVQAPPPPRRPHIPKLRIVQRESTVLIRFGQPHRSSPAQQVRNFYPVHTHRETRVYMDSLWFDLNVGKTMKCTTPKWALWVIEKNFFFFLAVTIYFFFVLFFLTVFLLSSFCSWYARSRLRSTEKGTLLFLAHIDLRE
jgi:hypothetical protein